MGAFGRPRGEPHIIPYSTWRRLYDDFVASERGDLSRVGIRDEARLRKAYDRYVTATEAQYDPFRIVAEVMKIIVGESYRAERDNITFEDGNRRMALVYAQRILVVANFDLKLTPKEGLELKENIRFWTVEELEAFIRRHAIKVPPHAMAFSTAASRLNSSLEIVSNHASNSSSVIEDSNNKPAIKGFRRVRSDRG